MTATLNAIFNASPHLQELAEKVYGTTELEASSLPAMGDAVAGAIATLQAEPLEDEAAIMTALRLAKQRASLAIALADRLGQSSVDQTTQALSDFADAAIEQAVRASFVLEGRGIAGSARLTKWKAIAFSAWVNWAVVS